MFDPPPLLSCSRPSRWSDGAARSSTALRTAARSHWLVPALVALALSAAACADEGGGEALGVDALSDLAAADGPQASSHGHDEHTHTGSGQDAYDNTDLSMINAASGEIPDVDMIDVSSGAPVNLQSLVGNTQPLLFWFWAPH